MRKNPKGMSYAKRVADVTSLYEHYARTGLSGREVWRRYIWPRYGICERTLYNMLGASVEHTLRKVDGQGFLFPEFQDEALGSDSVARKDGGPLS